MIQEFKLQTGKEVETPARMFLQKDLDAMDIPFVEKNIFLNKISKEKSFPNISDDIKKNMAVLNYRDVSMVRFSMKALGGYVKEQLEAQDSDFIIIPYFKDETDYDVKTKIKIAGKLKSNSKIKKPVILEISHKCDISRKEFVRLHYNFDYLSIFYGVYYGHYPTLARIAERILSFKIDSGKKVFCMATPIKFAGDNVEDCRFMPCFSIICDFWGRNWKQGRGNNQIKVVDREDLKSKNYARWSETYDANHIIEPVGLTVSELFRPSNKTARAHN